jgi:hypothetical protein
MTGLLRVAVPLWAAAADAMLRLVAAPEDSAESRALLAETALIHQPVLFEVIPSPAHPGQAPLRGRYSGLPPDGALTGRTDSRHVRRQR